MGSLRLHEHAFVPCTFHESVHYCMRFVSGRVYNETTPCSSSAATTLQRWHTARTPTNSHGRGSTEMEFVVTRRDNVCFCIETHLYSEATRLSFTDGTSNVADGIGSKFNVPLLGNVVRVL